MPVQQMGWQDRRPQDAPPRHPLRAAAGVTGPGHGAAFSGNNICSRLDAMHAWSASSLELQPSVARAPAVRNQSPVPGGDRVQQDAVTCCDGAQNGADVDRSLTKSEVTADPMPVKQMGWQDPRPQGAPQSPPAACGSMKYQAQAAARHSAAAFASDSARALDMM